MKMDAAQLQAQSRALGALETKWAFQVSAVDEDTKAKDTSLDAEKTIVNVFIVLLFMAGVALATQVMQGVR